MRRQLSFSVFVMGFALFAGRSSPALADGGGPERCELQRSVTPGERREMEQTIGRIRALLPAPLRGYKLHLEPVRTIPTQVARNRGCPMRVEFNQAYVSMASAGAAGGKTDVQRIQRLTREMQEAAARGDQAALERIRKQLAEAQRTPTESVGTTVNITINGFRFEHTVEMKNYTLAGATLAYTKEDPNGTTRVIIHLGRVYRSGNLVIGRPATLANQLPQHVEIAVSGWQAVAIAKSLNLKRLNALLK